MLRKDLPNCTTEVIEQSIKAKQQNYLYQNNKIINNQILTNLINKFFYYFLTRNFDNFYIIQI